MRKSADWMSVWDDRILEYVYENGLGRPSLLEESDIHITTSSITRRLQTLADHGLLESFGNGVYQITEKGILYLSGDYNAQTEEILLADNDQPQQPPNMWADHDKETTT